jgi:hypothetical protein
MMKNNNYRNRNLNINKDKIEHLPYPDVHLQLRFIL